MIRALVVLAGLGSAVSGWSEERPPDPLEPVNRGIFAFNDAMDRWVLKPVAQGYDRVTPDPVQNRVTNVFENLQTPGIALNQLLQGKPKRGLSDLTRFLINSTVGLGGLFDVAAANGLPRHDEDFGQTFALWAGGHQGAFLTLPFRGPATVSHAAGMVLDIFTNPLLLVSPRRDQLLLVGLDVIDSRAALLQTEQLISGDRYLFIRDAYLQSRAYEINDGEIEDDPFLDDF
jgi:phospholipid-binding lipoprotein MlaA